MPFATLTVQPKAFFMNTLKELFSIAQQTRFTYASAFYLLNDPRLKNKVAQVIRDRHSLEEQLEQLLTQKIDNRAAFTPLHQHSIKKHKGDESVIEQCIEEDGHLVEAINKVMSTNEFKMNHWLFLQRQVKRITNDIKELELDFTRNNDSNFSPGYS
jgi:hypothetical protein